MTEKEMRRLSRADLLEMLIDQSLELQALREQYSAAEEALADKRISLEKAGSIAEAALQLNGIFIDAEASVQQYMENIRLLSERQEGICARLEEESQLKAERLLLETQVRCEKMESETKIRCAEMLAKAKAESIAYWDELSEKLDAYYAQHIGLRELLSKIPSKI